MSDQVHVDYFRRRAEAERELARTAPSQLIGQIHARMADAYDFLAETPEQRDVLRVVSESLPRWAVQ